MNTEKLIKPLILLELNEINFDIAEQYTSHYPGRFPGIEKAISGFKIDTSAEENYEELEPWIQWVSAHTGMSFGDHQIFRLGDIVRSNIPQIYEQLEEKGIKVGCISPMNAENRLKKPAYFIPDPWTNTPTDSSWWSRRLGGAISQAVNDNSQSKITKESAMYIALGLIRFANPRHYLLYWKLISRSIRAPWRKALVLDLFLHDLHQSYFKAHKPGFSVLFLNAGAHIQHHYFLNSPYVKGSSKLQNPSWYISGNADPIFEMLEVYDTIVGDYNSHQEVEVIIATGLSQTPYNSVKFYYRLKDHQHFLKSIGINFLAVFPRMTRDFLVTFSNKSDLEHAKKILQDLKIKDKEEPLFRDISDRGMELFVTLTYPNEIFENDIVNILDKKIQISSYVSFVAIKNGMHQEKGFAFFTPGIAKFSPRNGDHVKNLYSSLLDYFNS
jgi:hypothetical protein